MNNHEQAEAPVADTGITRRDFAESTFLGAALSLLMAAFPAGAATPADQSGTAPNGKKKTRYLGLVLSKAVPGKEAELEKWFSGVHIPDVIKARDFKSGQLFRLDRNLDGHFPAQYIAVYNIETDDIEAVRADLDRLEKTGGMRFEGSEGVDKTSLIGSLFVPVGDIQYPAR